MSTLWHHWSLRLGGERCEYRHCFEYGLWLTARQATIVRRRCLRVGPYFSPHLSREIRHGLRVSFGCEIELKRMRWHLRVLGIWMAGRVGLRVPIRVGKLTPELIFVWLILRYEAGCITEGDPLVLARVGCDERRASQRTRRVEGRLGLVLRGLIYEGLSLLHCVDCPFDEFVESLDVVVQSMDLYFLVPADIREGGAMSGALWLVFYTEERRGTLRRTEHRRSRHR